MRIPNANSYINPVATRYRNEDLSATNIAATVRRQV